MYIWDSHEIKKWSQIQKLGFLLQTTMQTVFSSLCDKYCAKFSKEKLHRMRKTGVVEHFHSTAFRTPLHSNTFVYITSVIYISSESWCSFQKKYAVCCCIWSFPSVYFYEVSFRMVFVDYVSLVGILKIFIFFQELKIN